MASESRCTRADPSSLAARSEAATIALALSPASFDGGLVDTGGTVPDGVTPAEPQPAATAARTDNTTMPTRTRCRTASPLPRRSLLRGVSASLPRFLKRPPVCPILGCHITKVGGGQPPRTADDKHGEDRLPHPGPVRLPVSGGCG